MMNRRRFVGTLPLLSAGSSVAALSLTGCASVRYLQAREDDGRLRVRRSDFAGLSDVLVGSTQTAFPIYVREIEADAYSAVLAHCTHRGCQPDPAGDRLVCPCHGSEFAFTGDVLKGPAERPLDRFEVTTDGTDIIIWLSRQMSPNASLGEGP